MDSRRAEAVSGREKGEYGKIRQGEVGKDTQEEGGKGKDPGRTKERELTSKAEEKEKDLSGQEEPRASKRGWKGEDTRDGMTRALDGKIKALVKGHHGSTRTSCAMFVEVLETRSTSARTGSG